MKKKIGLFVLILFIFSSFTLLNYSSSRIEEISTPDLNCFESYLTTGAFSWNAGSAKRNITHLSGFTIGTGYTYEINSS